MSITRVTEGDVLTALSKIEDPDLHRDIVSLGFIKNLKIDGSVVTFDFNLTTPACPVKDSLRDQAKQVVEILPGVDEANVNMTAEVRQHAAPDKSAIAGIRNIVAVGSGKGGVGKSTVAINLAAALSVAGARVGLLDGDIYGPSIPIMMGIRNRELEAKDRRLIPHRAHDISFISMGNMAPEDKPLIWRGPVAHKAFQQCLLGTEWGELDYLLIDMPPGTGDVHITLVQTAPLTGAVLVSTPQDVGLTISLKTLRMFEQTKVHPLGIIENMSYYVCPHCGERDEIFGHGQVGQKSEELGIPFLGEIPLDPRIRAQADLGVPIVIADPQAPSAQAYRRIAELLAAQVSIQNYRADEEPSMAPREIRQTNETELAITWGDGHASTYSLRYLRQQCPCAVCVDELTHERRLDAAAVPHDIHILNISHVGNYAVRFDWSDGHNTGIYVFDRLRDLCQCALCSSQEVNVDREVADRSGG